MPPVGAISSILPVDSSSAAGPRAQPLPASGLSATRDAYSSMAGVAVRLLASLPANLGQAVDQSA